MLANKTFNICDFIKLNIETRKAELDVTKKQNHYIDEKCFNLLSLDNDTLLNRISLTNSDNFDIFYKISSKSFDTPFIIISNRIEGLNCLLSNINYESKIKFENIDYVSKYKYFLITFYILAGQVFSDGNHRVCHQYLLANGIEEIKILNIIRTIDSCRRYRIIDWNNLHEFIQKLINNLVLIVTQRDESIIMEKIENLFI